MEIDYHFLTLRNRKLLYKFGDFMVQHRGVERRNLGGHYLKLRRFLRWVELKAKVKNRDLRAEHVHQYLSTALKRKSRAEKKSILTILRGFLRFLYIEGRSRRRLDHAVPRMTIYKRAALPSYLTPEEVRRLLRAPDQGEESGRRDYAMLLLYARLSVSKKETDQSACHPPHHRHPFTSVRLDLTVIRAWLGHVSTNTTHKYIDIDLKMKQAALSKKKPPQLRRELREVLSKNRDVVTWLKEMK